MKLTDERDGWRALSQPLRLNGMSWRAVPTEGARVALASIRQQLSVKAWERSAGGKEHEEGSRAHQTRSAW